jgi:transposase
MELAIEGWDVHQEFCAAVRLNAEGNVLARRTIPTRREDLLGEAQRLSNEGVVVAMEASSTAVYVRKVLSEGGTRVVVGHPAAIARFRDPKVKDDWIDAKLLAELYRLGAFPAVHDPSEWALRARDVCRYRHRLGEEATEVKNRIRSLIARHGLAEEIRQPFNRAGLASLRRRLQKGQLPHEVAVVIRGELELLGQLQRLTESMDLEVARAGEERARDVNLLLSIRGCHLQLATTILAEIDGIERFPTPGKLAKYAGLTPGRNASAGISRETGITKTGSATLRWAMTMLAECAKRWEPRVSELYDRHRQHGKKPKEAITALARKMVVWIWHMLRRNEPFRQDEATREEAKRKWSEKTRSRQRWIDQAKNVKVSTESLGRIGRILEGLVEESQETPTNTGVAG